MPHVQEGAKEDIYDARKQLADAIGDLQAKADHDPKEHHDPSLLEKVIDPVKNLFRGGDESKKEGEGHEHECTKKEGECPLRQENIRDELKM